MTRVLVLGEALVDVVDGRVHPGGSPLNVAVGLGRLCIDATLATRFAEDAYGEVVARHLAASSVRLTASSTRASATSSALATVSPVTGAAAYEFAIDWDLPPTPVAGYDLVHAGSIGAYLSPGSDAVRSALGAAREHAVVSFDPNIRASLLPDHRVAVEQTERIVSTSHIVKLSDEDAEWLYPQRPLEEVLRQLSSLGPRLVVVTRGGEGYLADDGRRQWADRTAGPVSVVDTIGAGDAFMSGLLFAVASAEVDGAIRAGGRVDWDGLLDVALQSAAITVGRAGANPPRLEELDRPAPV
ncbi:carbohydrate kinase [Plantibacter flavus]|uniref:PfkB family carbohydrate kinase n=1 Tax=Plantibacter flavus TaxID=150123 RepID=UPI003F16641C